MEYCRNGNLKASLMRVIDDKYHLEMETQILIDPMSLKKISVDVS